MLGARNIVTRAERDAMLSTQIGDGTKLYCLSALIMAPVGSFDMLASDGMNEAEIGARPHSVPDSVRRNIFPLRIFVSGKGQYCQLRRAYAYAMRTMHTTLVVCILAWITYIYDVLLE